VNVWSREDNSKDTSESPAPGLPSPTPPSFCSLLSKNLILVSIPGTANIFICSKHVPLPDPLNVFDCTYGINITICTSPISSYEDGLTYLTGMIKLNY
jgi:hypothetical protein